jgi:hypothetical protein
MKSGPRLPEGIPDLPVSTRLPFTHLPDSLIGEGLAGAVELLPTSEEGDEHGLGDGRAEGLEDALGGLEEESVIIRGEYEEDPGLVVSDSPLVFLLLFSIFSSGVVHFFAPRSRSPQCGAGYLYPPVISYLGYT